MTKYSRRCRKNRVCISLTCDLWLDIKNWFYFLRNRSETRRSRGWHFKKIINYDSANVWQSDPRKIISDAIIFSYLVRTKVVRFRERWILYLLFFDSCRLSFDTQTIKLSFSAFLLKIIPWTVTILPTIQPTDDFFNQNTRKSFSALKDFRTFPTFT